MPGKEVKKISSSSSKSLNHLNALSSSEGRDVNSIFVILFKLEKFWNPLLEIRGKLTSCSFWILGELENRFRVLSEMLFKCSSEIAFNSSSSEKLANKEIKRAPQKIKKEPTTGKAEDPK